MKTFYLLLLSLLGGSYLQAQNKPTVIGDSVAYKGKNYTFIWYAGYNDGYDDGESNQYKLDVFRDTIFYDDEYSSSSRKPVSKEWADGYNTGYKNGLQSYYLSPSTYRKDSVKYKDKWVSKAWYNTHVEYETSFMPGLSYNLIVPKAQDSLGVFHGLGIEYLFYAKVAQNDNPGPSHVRFYGRLNLFNSTKSDIKDAFSYNLGLDMSLEKNPGRNFMVPFFGLEAGGISQSQLKTTVFFNPTFGIHLLSKKNIFAGIQGGYMYPIKNFDMLRGYTAQASLNVSFW